MYKNKWFGIKCFKHNGSIHRIWDRGLLLDENSEYFVIASKRAKVIEYNGRRWFTKEPAVTIFSKNEWWNVICMLKSDGICFYCNIASPSIIEKDYIAYIDYDLDTKLYSDGEIKVLDEKEYLHNKNIYKYSDELDKVLQLTTKMIIRRMQNKEFPFIDSLIKDYYDCYLKLTKKS